MEFLISFVIFFFLISLGLIVGSTIERKHFRDLQARETACSDVFVTQIDNFPLASPANQPPMMLIADTVIATDYLKTFLAGLRNLFGGEMRGYGRMVERARRESLLRLVEAAKARGYNAICNVRLDMVDIGGAASSSQKKNVMAAIQATATAYVAQVDERTATGIHG